MTKKKDDKPTKASATELEEKELDDVQGGATLDHVGNFNYKVEIDGVKPRLTDNKLGVRARDTFGVRAIDGTKLRK